MNKEQSSLETLQHIRSILDKNARFLSLSGRSGVWAGIVALVAGNIARTWLAPNSPYTTTLLPRFIALAVLTFLLAGLGAFYFTYRKNKKENQQLWNVASKKMLINLAIPLAVGAVMIAAFIQNQHFPYLIPAMLVFYGLALINGSKYTISDIKYLGLMEVILGSIALFLAPEYGIYCWAIGFGLLHIIYGMLMWRK